MEAIERWHAERPALPLRYGDVGDVAGLGAPPCLDLPRASAGPVDGPLLWAPALDLATGEVALVPFDAVDTCWLASRPPSPFFASTNGLASGSHAVEAALHGLCELIEHDATAMFERLPPEARAARRVDPAAVLDPAAAAVLARLAAGGFAVALWDTTSDIGVPAFACALVDGEDRRSPPGFGTGCHPDPGVAAVRALTEAAQTRLIALTGARDDLVPALFAADVGLRFRWALRETGGEAARPWPAAGAGSDDLRRDLAATIAAVTRAGAGPVLAVDLSREPGIAVIRILAPGLEPGSAADGVLPGRRAARAAEHMP
jgi:ribosomal protein S12 methylthiotransferase accessory factor